MTTTVRPAATVVLLRDTVDGLQTFLLRRTSTMAFAPRMHVFPGGRVDAADAEQQVVFTSGDVADLAARGSDDVRGIRALYVCAVRETQEEAGIVIAERDAEGRLVIDPLALPIIDHWVTPESESHRYDVRFFAAAVCDGQARLTTTEADHAWWITPADALDAFAAGELAMLPPTQAVLQYLSGFGTAQEVLAHGANRPVVPLLPRRLACDDGTVRWALVNERTGEVVADPVPAPHTRETDGLPRPPDAP